MINEIDLTVSRVEIGMKCGKPIYRILQDGKWNIVDYEGFLTILHHITPDTVFFDERVDHAESSMNDYVYISYMLKDWYKNNFFKTDTIVFETLYSTVKNELDGIKAESRMNHIKKVVELSEVLLLDWYQVVNGKMKCGSDISNSERIVYNLVENNMEWAVKLIAYLHDMFKYHNSEKEHGFLAAKFFKEEICESCGLDLSFNIIAMMYEALSTHSNKRLSLNNVFQRILVDADILSKYNMDTMYERKQIKYPDKSIREIFDMLDEACKVYVGKTPGFQSRLNNFYNILVSDIRIEEIKEGRRRG